MFADGFVQPSQGSGHQDKTSGSITTSNQVGGLGAIVIYRVVLVGMQPLVWRGVVMRYGLCSVSFSLLRSRGSKLAFALDKS